MGMFLGECGRGLTRGMLGEGKEPSQTPKFLSPSPGVVGCDRGFGVAPPSISLATRRGDVQNHMLIKFGFDSLFEMEF